MRIMLGVVRHGDENEGNSPGDPGNPVPDPQDDPPTPSE